LSADAGALFILESGGGLRAQRLAAGQDVVANLVEALRRRVSTSWRSRASGLAPEADRLGELLLAPAAAEIARAERLILLLDGALHELPFALLPDPGGAGEPLVARRAIQSVASIGVLARRAGVPRAPRPWRLSALVDPTPAAATVAALGEIELPPLAGARAEAAEAARWFPEARVLAGPEASEEALLAEARRAEIVHLGAHALVDARLPLSSSLVLASSAGAETTGLLHAWEVMERLETKAELVVLSACESARGEVVAGEGLLGLSWAFQRAGARAVLASLWRVDDEAAALFIGRFYRHLAGGAATPEALRLAQVELSRGPVAAERGGELRQLDLTAPRHWAGWVLIGG
jgi:CHAT domain-containing protein